MCIITIRSAKNCFTQAILIWRPENWFQGLAKILTSEHKILSFKRQRSMNKKNIVEFVTSTIKDELELNDKSANIRYDTPIIGSNSPIDSMGLVQLCLSLEEKAEELGFEFDWTTESAMSRSRGMFRSIESLSNEFVSQYHEKR